MRSQDIGDITEIDAGDKLLRGHIGEQFPERLALNFGPEVPDCVDHSSSGQVNSSLLWPDPAQLTVTGNIPPEGAHIGGERRQSVSDDERGQRPDGGDANLVSTSDSKGHAMPFQASRMVGLQNHIGCGIIRVVIHGIRASQGSRRRKTNIICLDTNNSEHHNTSPSSPKTPEIHSELRGAGDGVPCRSARCPRTLLFLKAGHRPARRSMSGSQLKHLLTIQDQVSILYFVYRIQHTALKIKSFAFRIDAIVHTR